MSVNIEISFRILGDVGRSTRKLHKILLEILMFLTNSKEGVKRKGNSFLVDFGYSSRMA